MTDRDDLPSKNRLNVIGKRIRKRARAEALALDGELAAEDERIVRQWRALHSDCLTTTRNGLGVHVMRVLRRDSTAQLVTQRLKRYHSIVAKLVRDKPRLSEIQDIAGCRAVLPSPLLVREVVDRIGTARKLTVEEVRDYEATPHSGGYRAVHVWCRRGDFKVEIQLRTDRQQQWAELVEEWDTTLGTDIKHESAPAPAIRYFRQLREHFHQIDQDQAVPDRAMLLDAAADVRRWLTEEAFA
ncbi:RelA/SpoT domain-containing protein [Saccharopolyspora sp. NPDC047091]|uniref:RelA/SpoT domain-containing protein n=1 Tax=Saccharopolyspora sp. NPDC047091 TaxID=3155924 RepID=UPI0033E91EF3